MGGAWPGGDPVYAEEWLEFDNEPPLYAQWMDFIASWGVRAPNPVITEFLRNLEYGDESIFYLEALEEIEPEPVANLPADFRRTMVAARTWLRHAMNLALMVMFTCLLLYVRCRAFFPIT